MTLLSFEVPSLSFNLASPSLQPNNTSFDSNVSGQLALTPPAAAAEEVYKQVINENQRPPTPPSRSTKSRVRQQRKYGEVVTTDEFINELKEKVRKKRTNSTGATTKAGSKRKAPQNKKKKAPKRTKNKKTF